ncbi:MAG: alpha/beta hydrolase family protein [Bacteroidales bacterium]|nr:alpha/beta hydrolase family protein [Bacteroidales bacterium]
MKKTLLTTLLFLTAIVFCHAAKVDTVQVYSPSMNKNIKTVIITPDNYADGKEYPVIYLLHGFGDDYSGWVKKAKGMDKLSDLYNIIFVCPDGAKSWYFDSPMDKSIRYETFVSGELVKWVDGSYKTIKDRSGRGITGLSMGGHGALYLAFRHQDVYGVAGSMSGGVDIRSFLKNWDLEKCLGKYSEYPDNWENNTVINLLHLLTPNRLAIFIDCGSEDFFYKVNVNLHEKLLERNIPHDFMIRPGMHNWTYWTVSIQYQALFMNRYFTSQQR